MLIIKKLYKKSEKGKKPLRKARPVFRSWGLATRLEKRRTERKRK